MTRRRPSRATLVCALALVVLAAGCGTSRTPSMLDTKGSEAQNIAGIWWLMFGLGAAVYVVVAGFIVWAIRRGRRAGEDPGRVSDNAWIVWGGIVVPVVILAVLAVVTVRSTSELRKPANGAVQVEVVGKRWWWDVSYPQSGFTTANEIHLPVDRPAEIHLDSDNVIHSFWVPQLAGKVDLVPGQHNILRFTPKTIGVYRGECAEFCGVEHGRMDFLVIVESNTDYERWLARRQIVPSPPDDEQAAEGQQVFEHESCAGCHTVRGTSADGTVGPDLTDFGSRSWIGAITIPNTPQNLAKWIVDAQNVKPGVLMPPISMSDADVSRIVAYLEGLK